ncbi:exodeoxyribonuclease VII small subunit [Merismopedia glauca]|uniref:Exodeoxyribonuclease 7 small subunit n=1 Tax=Merismopedia glauca CCAP 1448/3 TaxID=1296344 RepID=A0A2T1C7X5_9CYAN|nr:exodeoxyribonuclease VII small subunit [Merismopedia glauca]PSB04385.1 exodeoxyribonuclease VII small subunit [Merismopedia glauca CCAP 1448/3]
MSLNKSKNKSESILKDPDWTYEDTVAKAEKIINSIESGKLSLSEVFEQFQLASSYLRECERFLEQKRQEMNLSIEYLEPQLEE